MNQLCLGIKDIFDKGNTVDGSDYDELNNLPSFSM
jgi:hypothetical protein